MRELIIEHDNTVEKANHIINYLPCLEKLQLGNTKINNLEMLRIALTNCKRLTHVKIITANCRCFDISELIRLLKELGRKLVHFEFGNINSGCEISKLRQHFDVQFAFIFYDQKIVMRN